jgi:uncharacterized membrane protein
MKMIRSLLPHILVVLSGIFIVFMILDWYNPTMDFINNPVSLKLLIVFCVLSLIHSVISITSNRKTWREEDRNKP